MRFNLKTTLLFSASAAVALNVGQFFASYQQREVAFAPVWAQAASSAAAASPAPAAVKLAAAQSVPPAATPPPATSGAAPTTADAALATAQARLAAAGLKPNFATLYLSVQAQTGTPWQLLAAVHETETGQSGSTGRTSYAGAVGPMQFLPSTFSRYAADDNDDGVATITNVQDAMLTAGHYLAVSGAAAGNWSAALYSYNHSNSYVSHVLGIAYRLGL